MKNIFLLSLFCWKKKEQKAHKFPDSDWLQLRDFNLLADTALPRDFEKEVCVCVEIVCVSYLLSISLPWALFWLIQFSIWQNTLHFKFHMEIFTSLSLFSMRCVILKRTQCSQLSVLNAFAQIFVTVLIKTSIMME